MELLRIAELLHPFLQAPIPISVGSKLAYPGDSGSVKSVAEPAKLSSAQLQCISTYVDVLLRWNARMNLTAVREPEEIVTRHFGESLFAARCLFPEAQGEGTNPRIADVGSGAGFPGIPIKLWAPHLAVTLVESNQKKATFLREVIRTLTLTNIDVHNGRAQSLLPAAFDIVTLRAVERFQTILPIAAALVNPPGRLALLLGTAQAPAASAALSGWHFPDAFATPESRSRVVVIGSRRSNEKDSG